jgi:hypothetical protein
MQNALAVRSDSQPLLFLGNELPDKALPEKDSVKKNSIEGGMGYWSKHPLLAHSKLLSDHHILNNSTVTPLVANEHLPKITPSAAALAEMRNPSSTMMRDFRKLLQAKWHPAEAFNQKAPLLNDSEWTQLAEYRITKSVANYINPHRFFGGQHPKANSAEQFVHQIVDAIAYSAPAHSESMNLPDVCNQNKLTSLLESIEKRVAWMLLLQEAADDVHYTPHGLDHALMTALWIKRLIKMDETLLRSFAEQHNITPEQAIALAQMVGIMHDCGYPFMSGNKLLNDKEPIITSEKTPNKATHAVTGGLMFNHYVKPLLSAVFDIINVKEPDALLKSMVEAIHLHSSDNPNYSKGDAARSLLVKAVSGGLYSLESDQQISFLSELLHENGDSIESIDIYGKPQHQRLTDTCFSCIDLSKIQYIEQSPPPHRCFDACQVGDARLATPCMRVNRYNKPMNYWLMVADNLDVTEKRLGQLQCQPVYMNTLGLLYGQSSRIPKPVTGNALRDLVKNQLSDQFFSEASSDFFELLASLQCTLPHDLQYQLGLKVIHSIDIQEREGKPIFILNLQPLPESISTHFSEDQLRKIETFYYHRLIDTLKFYDDPPMIQLSNLTQH